MSAEDLIHKVSWELLFHCSINYQKTVVRGKVFSKTKQHYALDEILKNKNKKRYKQTHVAIYNRCQSLRIMHLFLNIQSRHIGGKERLI